MESCAFLIDERSLPSRERGLKSCNHLPCYGRRAVAPFAGAWIEMLTGKIWSTWICVAPFAGAWIEIQNLSRHRGRAMSLPSRERGLKYQRKEDKLWTVYVAPFAGAWIEICFLLSERTKVHIVAPFAGAWIEIPNLVITWKNRNVAPFAGAWIEIKLFQL